MVRLFNSVLLLCFALSLLVTSCSNAGVPLNGPPVVQETVSMELGEAVESSTESVSLEAAITGSGLGSTLQALPTSADNRLSINVVQGTASLQQNPKISRNT